MKDKNGNKFRYSNKMHIKRSKRLKYQKILQNYKDKNNISKLESELSNYNSKSCNLENFKEFICIKNKLNTVLLEKYKETIFRKLKWFAYIDRQKTENKLVNDIKKKFGASTLVFGDWSDKLKVSPCRLKYISTPNVALKRKLKEHFTIYNIDEFRTSCLSYRNEEYVKNLYVPDKNGKSQKLHSVLTLQVEDSRIVCKDGIKKTVNFNHLGCINRDENAVNNMIKIVESQINFNCRPLRFRREQKLE